MAKGEARRVLERFGAVIALAVLIAGTAVLEMILVEPDSRGFLKVQNFLNILRQCSFWGIVAVGMTFVITQGGIDLSVGALVAFLGGMGIYALNAAAGWAERAWVGIVAAAAVCVGGGVVCGALNGVVIAKGRIAPFVATLGAMAMFRALILGPSHGSEIRSAVPEFGRIGSARVEVPLVTIGGGGEQGGYPLALPLPVLVLLGVAAVGHVVLTRTTFGLRVRALGDNRQAARYSGIGVERVTVAVYAICGLTCGIAALLASSRLNSVSSSSLGLFYELDAIAAVVIGGTHLRGGSGSVLRTVVGVLIIGVVGNMLNMLQVSSHYQGLVKGLIIIGAVLIQPRRSE